MSDLQCPARLFVVSALASPPATALAVLREERVVAVYGPPDGHGAGVASHVAAQLGTPVVETAPLEDLADRHRGEAVVVVDHRPKDEPVVIVEIDADGRRSMPWP